MNFAQQFREIAGIRIFVYCLRHFVILYPRWLSVLALSATKPT
jgi:hypothetical protein